MLLYSITKHLQYPYKVPLRMLTALLLMVGIFSVLNASSWAQGNYRTLILSEKYNEHYLSPYITRYLQAENITDINNIITNSSLQNEILPSSGSIVLLSLNEDMTWLTFDVTNRSKQNHWNIEFGTSHNGRFGLFNSVSAYVFNKETAELKEFQLSQNKKIKLQLPVDEKSQVILKLKKTDSLPITTPLRLSSHANIHIDNFDTPFLILTMFLIGMVFFFVAVTVIKYDYSYLYFSLYYISLALLLFTQNNFVSFNWLFMGGELKAYTIFIVSIASLIIAHSFWYPGEYKFWTKPIFFTPVILGLISIFTGHFVNDTNNLLNFFLIVGPSILIILIIPLICTLHGQGKHNNTTPFMLGWFIFLFGICISILALSGIIQPVSTAINAYWITLVPQAIFFAIATRMDARFENENLTLAKTLEINESDSVSKLRQSKENTEQERLLKVIEQERKNLGELRKSEARQTEEMRKAKELADEANKGKSAFLAVVSHEIRTPMTGIMGMVRLLLNSNLTKEQNEYAQTIQDSSDAMLALLNDILDFEKIEQGKMAFENISFDLHRLIQGVATLMRGHAVQKGIDLSCKIGDDLPNLIMGDPTRLRQVLLNLTGNAVKFTEEGSVVITAELMKHDTENNNYEIYFNVTDNGIGISEEAKENLFSPFSQANNTISRKFGGTGLGLAISRGLVNGMGSDINISSVPGEGSTFFFTLRMDVGTKEKNESLPKTTSSSHIKKIQKILLIDDNKINRKVVRGLLADKPYKIQGESNAEDGLKALKKDQFDLILMDIELPVMNGDEATKLIRKSANNNIKDIPVIAITGNTQDEHINHYYDCGINACISKPIDPDTLIKTIENAQNGIFDRKKKTIPKKAKSPKEDLLDMPVNLELETRAASSSKAKPVIESDLPPTASPEAIKINKPTVNMSTPTKASNDSQALDLEILNSLKKHLSQDKIEEMINDVLDRIGEMTEELQAALNSNDQDIMSAKCHDLKGMAGNFGLKEISDLAKDIELKSKSQPSIIISTLINTLPDAKKRATTALSEWYSEK